MSTLNEADFQNKIQFILNQNAFNLRFIILNDGFYRKEKIEKFTERLNEGEDFTIASFTQQIKQPFLKSPLLEGLLVAKTHYNK